VRALDDQRLGGDVALDADAQLALALQRVLVGHAALMRERESGRVSADTGQARLEGCNGAPDEADLVQRVRGVAHQLSQEHLAFRVSRRLIRASLLLASAHILVAVQAVHDQVQQPVHLRGEISDLSRKLLEVAARSARAPGGRTLTSAWYVNVSSGGSATAATRGALAAARASWRLLRGATGRLLLAGAVLAAGVRDAATTGRLLRQEGLQKT
jgi:hypothetical protein